MKRLAAISLFVAVFVFPACAQRSASRGGLSYHSAPAFRGGFSSSRSSNFAASAHYAGNRYFNSAPVFRRGSSGNFESHPNEYWRRLYRPRRPRRVAYGTGTYYVVPGETGWIDPDTLDYGDTAEPTGYDDSVAASDGTADGDGGGPPEQAWPSIYFDHQSSNDQPHASAVPDNEEAVTLIFKDGRPSERIHNYAMTSTTLYVLDSPHHNIPLDQLNLSATTKLNDDAGVDFQLPQASK